MQRLASLHTFETERSGFLDFVLMADDDVGGFFGNSGAFRFGYSARHLIVVEDVQRGAIGGILA